MKNLLILPILFLTVAFCNCDWLNGQESQTTSPGGVVLTSDELSFPKNDNILLQSYNHNYRNIIRQITRGNEWLQTELKELGKMEPCSFSKHSTKDLSTNSADYIMRMITKMRSGILELLMRIRFYQKMELCARS